MAASLEDTGQFLLDDVDSSLTVVGVTHSDACVARVLELPYGTVFHSGVGVGQLRQAMLAIVGEGRIDDVITQETYDAAVDYYDALFVADAGNVEKIGTVSKLETQVATPVGTWTMGVFDMTVDDLSEDASFLAAIQTLWPDLGGRIVVLSYRSDMTLAGWTSLPPELFDGTYVYIFDRFDPDNSIGVLNPHGTLYAPGYGWQE
jgi:hypothetical protein